MMERNYRFPKLILSVAFLLIISGCTKDEKYKYLDAYTGNWQFRISRSSEFMCGSSYSMDHTETLYFQGSISKLDDNRGLMISYAPNRSVLVSVNNDNIIKETNSIGGFRENAVSFRVRSSVCGLYYTWDWVSGVKESATANDSKPPSAMTTAASGITIAGAILGGVVNAYSLPVDIEFEYGTTESYTKTVTANPNTVRFDMEVPVSAYISGLEPFTTYHYRLKVVNSNGSFYGTDMTFMTSNISDPVTDIDGNVYKTVRIGQQTWMAENLKTTKYRNGETITLITDNTQLTGLNTGAYCFYDYAPSNGAIYGALYNYTAVIDSRVLCPSGWHVPNSSEWSMLNSYLISDQSLKLNESGTNHWKSPYTGADNSSGFTALPGGLRNSEKFDVLSLGGYWWSATKDDIILLNRSYRDVYIGLQNYYPKATFCSVRCIKD
jgi:uncharacterized protein (TIGR02145 family)